VTSLVGSSNYNIKSYTFKIGNDGSIIVATKATLPKCTSLSSNTSCITEICEYECIKNAEVNSNCLGNDNVIRITSKNESDAFTCTGISSTGFIAENIDSNLKLHFFDEDYNEVTDIVIGMKNINMVYKCSYNENNVVKKCEVTSGTYIIGENKIECKGWKEDYCQVHDKYYTTTTTTTTTTTVAGATGAPGTVTPASGTGSSSGPTTINDDNKNKEGESGAVSTYYKFSSLLLYTVLFVLSIFIL